ncbi:MAG: cold-shock protein [Calditrichaeota bacterium]|nr:MAG: cold-shock protein [Calditrichota bacterium]
MQYGTVKMWDSTKNFGFIEGDDMQDYFVQPGDIEPTVPGKRLREGQRVGFDAKREMRGDRAVNVRLAK